MRSAEHHAHAIRLVLDRLVVEQLRDSLVGELNNLKVIGGARAEVSFAGSPLPPLQEFPSFTAATDHDPARHRRRLVTKELGGVIHRGV